MFRAPLTMEPASDAGEDRVILRALRDALRVRSVRPEVGASLHRAAVLAKRPWPTSSSRTAGVGQRSPGRGPARGIGRRRRPHGRGIPEDPELLPDLSSVHLRRLLEPQAGGLPWLCARSGRGEPVAPPEHLIVRTPVSRPQDQGSLFPDILSASGRPLTDVPPPKWPTEDPAARERNRATGHRGLSRGRRLARGRGGACPGRTSGECCGGRCRFDCRGARPARTGGLRDRLLRSARPWAGRRNHARAAPAGPYVRHTRSGSGHSSATRRLPSRPRLPSRSSREWTPSWPRWTASLRKPRPGRRRLPGLLLVVGSAGAGDLPAPTEPAEAPSAGHCRRRHSSLVTRFGPRSLPGDPVDRQRSGTPAVEPRPTAPVASRMSAVARLLGRLVSAGDGAAAAQREGTGPAGEPWPRATRWSDRPHRQSAWSDLSHAVAALPSDASASSRPSAKQLRHGRDAGPDRPRVRRSVRPGAEGIANARRDRDRDQALASTLPHTRRDRRRRAARTRPGPTGRSVATARLALAGPDQVPTGSGRVPTVPLQGGGGGRPGRRRPHGRLRPSRPPRYCPAGRRGGPQPRLGQGLPPLHPAGLDPGPVLSPLRVQAGLRAPTLPSNRRKGPAAGHRRGRCRGAEREREPGPGGRTVCCRAGCSGGVPAAPSGRSCRA